MFWRYFRLVLSACVLVSAFACSLALDTGSLQGGDAKTNTNDMDAGVTDLDTTAPDPDIGDLFIPTEASSCQDGAPCIVQGKLGECAIGELDCSGGGTGTCKQTYVPHTETCNGKDENCNGLKDDVDVAAHTQCGINRHCNGTRCVDGCVSNTDCGNGNACDKSTGNCVCGPAGPCSGPLRCGAGGLCYCNGDLCEANERCTGSGSSRACTPIPADTGPDTTIDSGPGDTTFDQPAGDTTVDTTSPDTSVDSSVDSGPADSGDAG
ncbi:MAG: hypothetical protein KC503_29605 [Myxococcales bacterium]|nr:hypothetical protein [Myxococcales bacterium]